MEHVGQNNKHIGQIVGLKLVLSNLLDFLSNLLDFLSNMRSKYCI